MLGRHISVEEQRMRQQRKLARKAREKLEELEQPQPVERSPRYTRPAQESPERRFREEQSRLAIRSKTPDIS